MRKLRYGFAAAVIAAAALAGAVWAQPYGPGMIPGGGYGPGMMGGYGPGWGGGGGGYGPGMMGGYGHGWMMQGYGGGYGPGMMYGYGVNNQTDMKLTAEQVKAYLQQMIRNPNLTVGDVKEKDADTVVAEIVTKQGNSLVQRLDFNRHNGIVQPEQ